MRGWLSVLVCGLMLAGCATQQATWGMVGGKQLIEAGRIEMELPPGWMRFTPAESDPLVKEDGAVLLVTRDGFGLQSIRLAKRPVTAELPFTKKKLAAGMLPHELAEVVFDNIRANPNILNQELIENSPASIGEKPGFKLVYGYQTKDGLRKKGVYYGCVVNDGFYSLVYEAPRRHYFVLDLATFEQVKGSLRWVSPTS